jgi:tetratricopeptide (TPR) repeat protein
MKKLPLTFLLLAGIFLALMPFAETSGQTKEPEPPPVSIWQARRLVSQDYATVIMQNRRQVKIDRSTFRLSTDVIDFDIADVKNGARQHFTVDLKNLSSLSLHCATDKGRLGSGFWNCVPSTAEGKPLTEGLLMLWEGGGYTDYCISLKAYQSAPRCASSHLYNAKLFGSALFRLHQYSSDPAAPLRNFTQLAAAWRALATKPPLPEEARVQLIMAEEAIKDKKPDLALIYYEKGLGAVPTWPEGWYNAALLDGELGFYDDAVDHMHCYLDLLPNAPDEQAVRDQIAVWKYKAVH